MPKTEDDLPSGQWETTLIWQNALAHFRTYPHSAEIIVSVNFLRTDIPNQQMSRLTVLRSQWPIRDSFSKMHLSWILSIHGIEYRPFADL